MEGVAGRSGARWNANRCRCLRDIRETCDRGMSHVRELVCIIPSDKFQSSQQRPFFVFRYYINQARHLQTMFIARLLGNLVRFEKSKAYHDLFPGWIK